MQSVIRRITTIPFSQVDEQVGSDRDGVIAEFAIAYQFPFISVR